MKVLWFSNVPLLGTQSRGSGSWLFAMKDLLKERVCLYNISEGDCNSIVESTDDGFNEILLPQGSLETKNLDNTRRIVNGIIENICPDIIHIWGLERNWTDLLSGINFSAKVLLEIQGLQSSLVDVYTAKISLFEFLSCFGLSEIKSPFSFPYIQKYFIKRNADRELSIISSFDNIGTPSEWCKNQLIFNQNSKSRLFSSRIPLRKEFYRVAERWQDRFDLNNPELFFSTAYFAPYKGFHIAILALGLLKKQHPNIILKVAAPDISKKHSTNSYERYILKLIDKYNLSESIVFLGLLKAEDLIKNLLSSMIYLNPSFVESYSVATAEALYLGVPSVLAYSGALPEFSKEGKTALYYSNTDYRQCAALINELIVCKELRNRLSVEAMDALSKHCDPYEILNTQLSIYSKIIEPEA